jgi:Flp pilus assembly protein TadG
MKYHQLMRRWRRARHGAAVVEFAVVSPVLIILLLGMLECGRMIMVQQSLATAAREGARSAIVQGTSVSTAKSVVESFLAGVGVTGTDITVSPIETSSLAHGQPITVSVSVAFSKVSWLPHPFFLKNTTLSSTATMRRETPN